MSQMSTQISDKIALRGKTFKNRLIKGAMSEALANKAGEVSTELLQLYRTWGQGDIGAVITGNVMIDSRAKNEPGVVVIENNKDILALRKWAAIGKQYDMRQIVQLSHPGKQCPKGLNKETVAPSAIGFNKQMEGMFPVPRALTEVEILDIIQRFANAANICEQAGFDGVQIHGAHGYLVSQFLSPKHNQRVDQWGGCIENRMQFLLQIYQAIREQTSENFLVTVKLNSADFQRGGFTEEESLAVIKALSDAQVDMIEISGGTYENPVMTGVKQSTREREAYFIEFADKVRQISQVPLMVTGGFRTRMGMDAALHSGACDFIGIARPLAVEPDAPQRLLAGNDVKYAIKPIKTGIKAIDSSGFMEVIWYAAQFNALGKGKPAKPNLSPYVVLFHYMKKSATAILQGKHTFFGRLRTSS